MKEEECGQVVEFGLLFYGVVGRVILERVTSFRVLGKDFGSGLNLFGKGVKVTLFFFFCTRDIRYSLCRRFTKRLLSSVYGGLSARLPVAFKSKLYNVK